MSPAAAVRTEDAPINIDIESIIGLPVITQNFVLVEGRPSLTAPYCECKKRITVIAEGTPPHGARLNCVSCGHFREWLDRELTMNLLEAVKAVGRWQEPLIIRKPAASSGANAAGSTSACREQ